MADLKPIETFYNGFRFRSRLEARWAVFFDALGVRYEYEPEGFELPNGKYYLPDFRVKCYGTRGMSEYWCLCERCKHCTYRAQCGDMADWYSNPFCEYVSDTDLSFVRIRSECGGGQDKTEIVECDRYERVCFDLYIEVKGKMTKDDAERLKAFAEYYPVLIVGNIPPSGGSYDSYAVHAYDGMDGTDICPFNYQLIDGDYFAAYPAAHNGLFYLWGDDSNYIEGGDVNGVERAYDMARQARFEHNEKPNTPRRY